MTEYCPLKPSDYSSEHRECDGSACAWWDMGHQMCAVAAIADKLCRIRYKEPRP